MSQPKPRRRSNGEGTTCRRFDGTWEAKLTIGTDSNGKQLRKSFYGRTQKEAREKMEKAKEQLKQGYVFDSSKRTIAEWLDNWLWEYKRQNIKPKTFDSYHQNIENYLKPCLGTVKLTDLRVEHVQRMINDMGSRGLSSSTIRSANVVLKAALSQAVKNGLLMRNVSDLIELPKKSGKKEIRVLSREEQSRFLEVSKEHELYPSFLMLLSTGIRIGELLALTWQNVDLEHNLITISQNNQRIYVFDDTTRQKKRSELVFGEPKTDKGNRVIPILPELTALLRKHRTIQREYRLQSSTPYHDHNLVFATSNGTPIDQRNYTRVFKKLLTKAGINPKEVNVHALRHTFATRGLENGVEMKVMQELLGHSSITVTADFYSHVLLEKKREGIEKMKGVFV